MTKKEFLKYYDKERPKLIKAISKITDKNSKKRQNLLKKLGLLNKEYVKRSKPTKAEIRKQIKELSKNVIMSEPKFVGKMAARKDLEVEPESEESKQAKRDAYNQQQEKIKNDPEYAKQLEEDCKKWHEEEKEFLRVSYIEREASWAVNIPPPLIEPRFYKPYPKLSNPDIPFSSIGFEFGGVKVLNNLGDVK